MDLWRLSAGVLFLLFGLIIIVHNEFIIQGVFGRTITGFILVMIGVLIILLKYEKVHYTFFIAAFISLIKLLYGLYETNMKIVGFLIGDIIMVLVFVIVGLCIYYYNKKKNI